jgi:hypothetical protein
MRWAQRSAKTFWYRNMLKSIKQMVLCVVAFQGACVAVAQTTSSIKPVTRTVTGMTVTAVTPTPSQSTSTQTTATKKPSNKGEIYRWTDSQGRVQYGAEVPEDRRSTARKVDTRSNIVSSRVPARVVSPQAAKTPDSPDTPAVNSSNQPTNERERCEAAWKQYKEAQACFEKYRRGSAAGQGNKAGSSLSPEAFDKCPTLTEPAACR